MSLTPPPGFTPTLAVSKLGNPLLPIATAYIVCYRLSLPEEQYSNLIVELTDSKNWCHFIPGVWIVIRRETLIDFAEILRRCILASDYLIVMPAKGPADGILPAEIWPWIEQYVPRDW